MIKAIGFLYGWHGDALMAQALCRTFKQQNKDSHLTFAVNKKYQRVLPLLFQNPYIDGFHIWDGSDDFPTQVDSQFIQENNFDIVFNPKAQHKNNSWYLNNHYIDEMHEMFDFSKPENKQIELTRYFESLPSYSNYIALSLVASGNQLSKTISFEKIRELIVKIRALGLTPIRIDSRSEYDSQIGIPASQLSIFDATVLMLSTKMLITVDTLWAWASSGYSFPTIGLYAPNYPNMPIDRVCSHMPVNTSSTYLVGNTVNDISVDQIIEEIKYKLK